MIAAVLEKLHSPLTIAEVGLTDLGWGQVHVKIEASGICGAQLQEISGKKGNEKFLPHLLGHEGAGIVKAVGIGVTSVHPGDKVCLHWRKGDGIESDFPKYVFNGRTIQSGKVTTFSTEAIVSENRITKVPASTPVELCALLGCGLSTALGTMEREAHLKLGESVLIVGVGGLGVNLIRAAQLLGAYPIVAMDVRPEKEKLALSMGAHIYTSPGNWAMVGKGFDVIVDTCGVPDAIRQTFTLLAGGGRYIMVGQPDPFAVVYMDNARHMFDGEGKTIKATQGGGFKPSEDIPRYVKAHAAGILKLDGIISDRIMLTNINEGIDMVKKGCASRVLVYMSA
jgi:S-(hydroxymethyl)glutathione dehydrogenase/alcohol dehydrogenase